MENQFSTARAAFGTCGARKNEFPISWNDLTNTHTSKEEIMGVYSIIAETIADALPCEVERVKFEASLIDDLAR